MLKTSDLNMLYPCLGYLTYCGMQRTSHVPCRSDPPSYISQKRSLVTLQRRDLLHCFMLSCSASCLLLETFPFFPACSLTLKTSLGQVNKFQAMEDIFQAKTSQKNVCKRINHAHQIKLRELNTKGKQMQMIILIANPRTHIIFQRQELFLMYHKFFFVP